MTNAVNGELPLEEILNGVCFARIVFIAIPKQAWLQYPKERPLVELVKDAEGCEHQTQNGIDVRRQTELHHELCECIQSYSLRCPNARFNEISGIAASRFIKLWADFYSDYELFQLAFELKLRNEFDKVMDEFNQTRLLQTQEEERARHEIEIQMELNRKQKEEKAEEVEKRKREEEARIKSLSLLQRIFLYLKKRFFKTEEFEEEEPEEEEMPIIPCMPKFPKLVEPEFDTWKKQKEIIEVPEEERVRIQKRIFFHHGKDVQGLSSLMNFFVDALQEVSTEQDKNYFEPVAEFLNDAAKNKHAVVIAMLL